MKQGKTEKAVFAKLSTQKVELASVQDYENFAEKLLSDILNNFKSFKGYVDEVMSGAENLKRIVVSADKSTGRFLGELDAIVASSEKKYKEIEQASKELGVDVPKQAVAVKNELEKIAKRYSNDVKGYSSYFDRVYKGL